MRWCLPLVFLALLGGPARAEQDLLREVRQLGESLDRQVRAEGPAALVRVLPARGSIHAAYLATRRGTRWRVELEPLAQVGEVVLARLRYHGDDDLVRPVDVTLPVAVTREAGTWRLSSQLPETGRVERTRAQVWVAHARGWLAVEVELDIDADGSVLVLQAPRGELSLQRGDAWIPGKATWIGTSVVVEVPRGRSRLRWRREGNDAIARVDSDETHLLGWAPATLRPARHDMEVVVHVAPDEELLASMALHRGELEAGWQVFRGRQVRDRVPHLAVGKGRSWQRLVKRWLGRGKDRIDVFGRQPYCRSQPRAVLLALGELLPLGSRRLVAANLPRGAGGESSDDLVLLSADTIDDLCRLRPSRAALILLAHELAHAWFGQAVLTYGDTAGLWYEALADYVATVVVDGSRDYRCQRAADYARAEPAIYWGLTWEPTDRFRDEMSYGRGMLLLTALEDRLGRARLFAALRRFVNEWRGKPGSWDGLVAAVAAEAGPAEADWFRLWLDRPGAPRLTLAEAKRVGDRLAVELRQEGAPWEGTVELVFSARGRAVGRVRVDFAGAATKLELPIPARADQLVVDPDCRLPRRFRPERGGIQDGTAVRIPATDGKR